jgi:hypothetical protein
LESDPYPHCTANRNYAFDEAVSKDAQIILLIATMVYGVDGFRETIVDDDNDEVK